MSRYNSTILVTGGTMGLGYEAALAIAKAQPDTQVVICSRTDKEKAADSINTKTGQQNVVFKRLDLADQTEIRSFASEWSRHQYAPISALVLNAGLQFPSTDPIYTKDGIEITFGVNHVGHALLFYLLRPHLTSNCRIVLTASGVHDPAQKTGIPDALYTSVEELAHPTGEAAKVSGLQRYSTSKLCNVLWMYALDHHLEEIQKSTPANKWTVSSMDPGLMVETALSRAWPAPLPWLARNVLPYLNWLIKLFAGPNVHTAAESGAALARLAIADDVQGVSAKYYQGFKEIPSSTASQERVKQDEIWSGTARLIAKNDSERKSFEALS